MTLKKIKNIFSILRYVNQKYLETLKNKMEATEGFFKNNEAYFDSKNNFKIIQEQIRRFLVTAKIFENSIKQFPSNYVTL